MNWDELATIVIAAWNTTAIERPDLFADDASEDALRGQLVKRLELVFKDSGFEIDVNYNVMNYPNNVRGVKRLDLGADETGRVLIDIVIHRPGSDGPDSNLLAIELKKKARDSCKDVAKLRELTSPPAGLRPFQYQFGLLIRYQPSSLVAVATLFQNGVQSRLVPATLLKIADG